MISVPIVLKRGADAAITALPGGNIALDPKWL
jgi:hypothetical protein